MSEEHCPFCSNHCSKENLGCGRGRNYFDNKSNRCDFITMNEQIIIDLRKCGNLLHYNRNLDIDKILLNFSEDELNKLHELLSKINNNIE